MGGRTNLPTVTALLPRLDAPDYYASLAQTIRTESDVRAILSGERPAATRFFHGTSDTWLESILATGLSRPFLADREALAAYYADVTCEVDGGQPVILEVAVDVAHLRIDVPAMVEPVKTTEEAIEAAITSFGLDGVNPWAMDQVAWEVSWLVVGSVRYEGTAPVIAVVRRG
jgi:hypothetical protein